MDSLHQDSDVENSDHLSFLETWGAPIGLCLTLFVVAYSVGAVPAIMPRIVRELNSSIGYVQGALVLLALVKASFTPSCENLVRRFSRKWVYLSGLGIFTIGIIATALSRSMGMFVVSYSLIAGVGATPLIGSPRDMATRIYDNMAEKYALLALAVSSILGGLTGALLGGRIASQVSWRWSFVPVLLLVPVIVFLIRRVPRTHTAEETAIDWIGGLLSFMGFGLSLMGISLVGEYGWWEPKQPFKILDVVVPISTIVSIVVPLVLAGVICLGLFAFWQRQKIREQRSLNTSIVRMGLLGYRPFLLGLMTATLHTLLTTGIQFNLYQFIPAFIGLNPFWTAIAVLPYTLSLLVVIIFSTFKVVGKYHYKLLIHAGLAMFCVGVLELYRVISPTMTILSLMPALIVMGAGSGLFLAQISIATFANATREQRAEANGIYTPFQNLGSALGRAILGTILVVTASTKIVDKAIATLGDTVSNQQRQRAIETLTRVIQTFTRDERKEFFENLPDRIQPVLDPILDSASVEAMKVATLIALGLSIVCLASSLLLPSRPTPASRRLP